LFFNDDNQNWTGFLSFLAMPIKKVLLIQNKITLYNLPIYNILGREDQIDLTIAHFDSNPVKTEKSFKEILLHFWKVGPIFFSKENLFRICMQYDVIICMADIHWFSLMSLAFRRNRRFKLIYWGIGVSASYANKYDQNTKWDFVKFFFMKRADALIFYSSYPVAKYIRHGFEKKKLFVAHNTVEVKHTLEILPQKDSILFIGMLYNEKGVFELLTAYKSAYIENENLPDLIIIGDGDEFTNIAAWIDENNLKHKIIMKGAIYDDIVLEQFFHRSIACISPNQAGLSVLKSMGYGVPFITRYDSITGGERFNIINNETGLIFNNKEELISIIRDMEQKRDKFLRMGENSKKFYDNYRRPDQMVQGFLDAIIFVFTDR